MGSIRSSLFGSLVATIIISLVMIEKNALRFIPEFTIQRAWSEILGAQPWAGWVAFLFVGVIVGGLVYALLYSALPTRSPVVKGLAFGVLAWLVTMLVFMPLAGVGVFAAEVGTKLVVFNLALNVVYGLVLGGVYAWDNAPATPRRASQTR